MRWWWTGSLVAGLASALYLTPTGQAFQSLLLGLLVSGSLNPSNPSPPTSPTPVFAFIVSLLLVLILSRLLAFPVFAISFLFFPALTKGRRHRLRPSDRWTTPNVNPKELDTAAIHTSCSSPNRYPANRLRSNSYGPPYPNGWYKLADSAELRPGDVRKVNCLSLQFVLFRTESGKAAVLDAYCPHMGADMSVGGTVVGECVSCPFHRWEFDSDGKCTRIPYAEKVPDFAKTKAYKVIEYHSMILIYYDAEGRSPPYVPSPVKEIDDGSFVYRGRYDQDVKMHIQEFAENTGDYQHFEPLHTRMMIPFTNIPVPFIKIVHEAGWRPDASQSHISYFTDSAHLSFRGKDIPRTNASAWITFIGPGSLVTFRFTTEMGEIHLFQTHTPVEPLLQKVCFVWYADKRIPKVLVSYVIGNWIAQWGNDVAIWENKKFAAKPILVKEDGPIKQVRRWYAQFVSEHSLSMAEADALLREGGKLDW